MQARTFLAAACTLACSSVGAQEDAAHAGIWKAVVPPNAMHGEFDNRDPIGLISGADIPADCSINWRSPDTHKLYCFSTGTSLLLFLEWPASNTRMADAAWQKRLDARRKP